MTKKEILVLANKVCEGAKSMKDINAKYNEVKAEFGQDIAKEVIDAAKALRRRDLGEIDGERDAVIDGITGERVLVAVFKELSKDKNYGKLCFKAQARCKDVSELVANWYPHTISGVPARKVTTEEGGKVWMVKEVTRSNAAGILVSCVKNIAKAAKKQKSGTVNHIEGEEA